MSFEDLKAAVAETSGLSKAQSGQAITALFEHVQDSLRQGEKVAIPGFGTFDLAERAERQGRNPRTGETIAIAASKQVKFKPGKVLKDAVNG